MKASTDQMERQVREILDNVEAGMEAIDRYGRPWVQRHRVEILAAGVAVIAGIGALVMINRRRRRRTLVARLHEARTTVGDRLERPISSLRSAAERMAR